MLNKGVDEVLFEGGKAWGVKTGNEVAKASMIIGDPSYFDGLDKLRVSGKIIRTICILDHPIPGKSDFTFNRYFNIVALNFVYGCWIYLFLLFV